MFFAHMALRPAVNALLEPPLRLPLMLKVLDAFFPWVWVSVFLLLATGYWMLFTVYAETTPVWLWLMAAVGTLMGAIFVFIYAIPYHQMAISLERGEIPAAGRSMVLIRRLIGFNLSLGLIVSVVAVGGKYF
jgi:uncharacterized membrane protein